MSFQKTSRDSKMRILILTAIPFWHPGTNELIQELRKKGVLVDALDIFHGYFLNDQNQIINLIRLPKFLRRVYLKLFRKRLLTSVQDDYDIIDIHFVEPYYAKYVLELQTKLICTLFGSDLYRTSLAQKKMQAPLFQKANGILLSQNMLEQFEKDFGRYPDKYLFCQYGSKRLDLLSDTEKTLSSTDTIRITLGYNNKREQQHDLIIDAIKKLPQEWKERIELLLPMTYGDDHGNVSMIERILNDSGFKFEIFKQRLSDSEIVDLWKRSDIMINMQVTDALASSIKESMAAGNLLIVGDWLPYGIYEDLGIYLKRVNFANLDRDLLDSLQNLENELVQCKSNKNKIIEFASWGSLINVWEANYKKVCSGS